MAGIASTFDGATLIAVNTECMQFKCLTRVINGDNVTSVRSPM